MSDPPFPFALRRTIRKSRLYARRLPRVPAALRLRQAENREVARLQSELGPPQAALVVTVITTYRRPKGLIEAVESALAQTVAEHLVCVVDDGGGLPPLPRDLRLLALSLSRNYRCLGMVRNVGIRVTDSSYLAFLDDDNTWMPNHLEVSLEAHAKGADLTYTALDRFLPDGSSRDVLSVPFDRKLLWMRSYTDTNAIVVRRAPGVIFSRIPGIKHDWELVLRLSRRIRLRGGQLHVKHIPVPTVRYLLNPDSYYNVKHGNLSSR